MTDFMTDFARGLVLCLFALAASSAAPTAAAAQTNPLGNLIDSLFGSKPAEKPVEAPSKPPSDVSPGNQANIPGKPLQLRPGSPGKPEQQKPVESPGAAAAVGPKVRRGPPLPPRRPANIGEGSTAALARSVQPPVKEAASEPQASLPTTPTAALARVNAFLNGFEQITGTFVQLNPDGQRVGGSILVQRPGRLRFKYDPPSTLEVVADGRSVAVREARFAPQVYSMSETPLKFLLKERVDLAADARLVSVRTDPDGLIHVALEDTATFGGTSKVTLYFDAKANLLKRWDVVDPQGNRTSVALNNLDITRRAAGN